MKAMTAAGSIDALRDVLGQGTVIVLPEGADVVIVPTASVFSGAEAAAIELAHLFETGGAKVEALMNISRDSSDEPHFAQRVHDADLVVLSDGSALHAKSVWRGTLVGEAIRESHRVAAIGSVASVLGDVMVDPRGGAPTIGLGYVSGLVVGVSASEEQLARTRVLLGEDATFAVLGRLGVVHFDGTNWRVITADVVTTRGAEPVEL
jgi:cyanophycinase-like exopeptidase